MLALRSDIKNIAKSIESISLIRLSRVKLYEHYCTLIDTTLLVWARVAVYLFDGQLTLIYFLLFGTAAISARPSAA